MQLVSRVKKEKLLFSCCRSRSKIYRINNWLYYIVRRQIGGVPMLAAVKGKIRGNIVVIDDDIQEYDGTDVIVTLLGQPQKRKKKPSVNWDSFAVSSDRGQHVDEYIREMREDDRL